MTAIDFPNSPSINDTFAVEDQTWRWNGDYWKLIATPGAQGEPGEGVAVGGTEGQVLAKASGDDYDTEWVDVTTQLSDLTDVSIATLLLEDGEILQYNATSQTWVNGPRPITSTIDGGDPASTYAGDAVDGGDPGSF